MAETKQGLLSIIKSYPSQFWVANTMEIFERMSWYGWFTVMALYVTGSVETGGLGFTTETRGALQAIVPFFLYVIPVFTGALADRYGFKKTFITSYFVMIAAYYLLGQFTTFPTFFMAFMFVAVGAALFKPVVVGTVAKVTTEGNSATGFGIFYMMVNIGGFAGPIVAGIVRGQGWKWVFVACSFWAFINLIIVLTLYREPKIEDSQRQGGLQKVLDNMVEVLGNVRFFLTVFVVLFALMFANLRIGWFEHFTWLHCAIFVPVWLIGNAVYDLMLPKGSGQPTPAGEIKRPAMMKRMHCSNWRFALFLLIMSGFWTSFNQIFYTMPEYIRDFTETRPMIEFVQNTYDNTLEWAFGARDISPAVATINQDEQAQIVHHLRAAIDGGLTPAALEEASRELLHSKVRITPDALQVAIDRGGGDVDSITAGIMESSRQFNPEFVVNINAGAIVLFQVFISFLMARFHRFTTMIVGMVIAAVGIGFAMFAGTQGIIGLGGSIWVVALGLFIFSFGEMMASPTSQEYVGRIAPKDKKALYMGYYFVAIALGNLFGGILSGELYGKLARDMQRPDLMWLTFGALMLFTALIFVLYNIFALPKHKAEALTP
ncbi:MAG: MFS transporter [Acidobacteria bacterium]|uniref:MFS transporter n=1 Tax=Candidatus Polarisedimenticola svalbardensis TaxID=2886004 RepID=A0A8J7C1F5_9BACT|nr:MFS transporter [Candidatus Polarisedimenticola svalbardensis]